MLDVVITMGGLGKRFREVGYSIPKYMIEVRGKTLFEWSMSSLEGFSSYTNMYYFVVLRETGISCEDFIHSKCCELSINNYKIIELDHLTDGQATTAMKASKYWNIDNELLIYNIDTYVEPKQMKYSDIKGDGFIPCFFSEGNHWSFVKTDINNKAVEIKEKVRISDNCTIGAYYFKSCKLFEAMYREFYSNVDVLKSIVNGEKYISPIYNYMIEKGKNIFISKINSEKVHVLGTPEELELFLQQGEQ